MFFYISGMGATFFNTEEKNFGIFVGEKALRLLVPFIVGIFLFLIPRLYFGQSYEDLLVLMMKLRIIIGILQERPFLLST